MVIQPETQLLKPENFEKTLRGKPVQLFTLTNQKGTICQVTNYGARIVSLWTQDRAGNLEDIVLGFDSIDGYLNSPEYYFGSVIGRVANRIAKGRFHLENKTYLLDCNDGPNHLHGGVRGFHTQVWKGRQISSSELELLYASPDGEEGYPGNLEVRLLYKLSEENQLEISYTATTDKTTPVNLTNHSYFNLKGAGNGTIKDHILQISAENFTPIRRDMIPSGEIRTVENTSFDYRKPVSISSLLYLEDEQMTFGFGFDHNFVLNGTGIKHAANVVEPTNGRSLEVFTTEFGMQFYSGNFLDGTVVGKKGKCYSHRSAFCLETQNFPNALNQPSFPSCILEVGETYQSSTIYKFGVRGK